MNKENIKGRGFEIIIFLWKDATIHSAEQNPRSYWEKQSLISGVVAGHVILEDKDKIIVGLDLFPKQPGQEEDNYRNVAVYPKSGIVKIIKRIKI